jgi:hypothetical protein
MDWKRGKKLQLLNSGRADRQRTFRSCKYSLYNKHVSRVVSQLTSINKVMKVIRHEK